MKRQALLATVPETFTPSTGGDGLRVSRKFEFKLITPMFGGDVKSWEINTRNPVRAQAIKGQLRFWWRTMQNEPDPRTLLYSENLLWGGKTKTNDQCYRTRSSVSISVDNQVVHNHKDNVKNVVDDDGKTIPKYVGFPVFNSPAETQANATLIAQLDYDLHVSYPREQEKEVLNTLKLWCLFGGVGARTRRGCGSLYCEELLSDFNDKQAVYDFVSQFGCNSDAEAHSAPYPKLKDALLALGQPEQGDSVGIWYGFVSAYGTYRQMPGCGRNGTLRNPGRSYWPEPDSLRNITGQNDPQHVPVHRDMNWFPRAAYGLPIITRFKDKGDPGRGEQINIEPSGQGNEGRWPSPVVLKVIKLPSGDIFKCCLVLNAKPPDNIVIRGPAPHLPHTLTDAEKPLSVAGKVMKTNDNLQAGENPYTALIHNLKLKVGK